jgi:hypothetical protein
VQKIHAFVIGQGPVIGALRKADPVGMAHRSIVQVPPEDDVEIQRFLTATGNPHQPEGDKLKRKLTR